jgi:hypothetical protein
MEPFEAWALPAGVAVPGEVHVDNGGGSEVVRVLATADWIEVVCAALEQARTGLAEMPVRSIALALGRVGERFLDREDPLRRRALEVLPETSGLSPQMCAVVLDGMAREWTAARLEALVERELGGADAVDRFVETEAGENSRAVGPSLCTQVVSGSVPGVSATALVRSLLVKGPTLVKPGLGDVALPVLFVRALAEMDRRLADAAAVVYWPGGSRDLEAAAVARADVVVAYGSDDTVRSLRGRAPASARFVGYHHRVSVGAVGREALSLEGAARTAVEVAESVAMFDQRGCVSPQVVWVEEGGTVTPDEFAAMLADALEDLEARWPTGSLDAHEAAWVQQVRGSADLRRASGLDVRLWRGAASSWTVVYEGAGESDSGSWCVGRVARVRPIRSLDELPGLLAPMRRHLQTVALAVAGPRRPEVAAGVAAAGATRVAGFPQTAFPPAWWRQDGRGVLQELVTWVEA